MRFAALTNLASRLGTIVLLAGLSIGASRPLVAAESIPGPVAARVVRVIDGDTVKVEALIWIGQHIVVNARVRGIDTPELRGDCAEEIERAYAARMTLDRVLSAGSVRLTNIAQDKFGGRVVADIAVSDDNVADAMLASGLARPYAGGKREPWCPESG